MVPHWDYLASGSNNLDKPDTPVADSVVPTSDRPQRRSRVPPMHQNILAKQQSVGGEETGPKSPSREPDAENATGDSRQNPWRSPVYRGEKRPDYIVKADEDSFIVLGELERRLRVSPRRLTYWGCKLIDAVYELSAYFACNRSCQRPLHGRRMLRIVVRPCLFRRKSPNLQRNDSRGGRQISCEMATTASTPRRNLVGE